MKKCTKCGADRVGEERFCATCGADVSVNRVGVVGKWLSGGGCLLALSPIAFALLATPIGGNMFSAGGDGGGAALFLLILSLPTGLVVSVVGLVLWLNNRKKQ